MRTIARRTLTDAGFEVLEANEGGQALSLIARHEQIDVVLSDLAMPGLSGRELAERLSEIRPGLPVVFMSGYTDDDLTRRGLLDAGIPYLEKPFSPEALARMIREVCELPDSLLPALLSSAHSPLAVNTLLKIGLTFHLPHEHGERCEKACLRTQKPECQRPIHLARRIEIFQRSS